MVRRKSMKTIPKMEASAVPKQKTGTNGRGADIICSHLSVGVKVKVNSLKRKFEPEGSSRD